jgi:uncharacterized protein (TIGR04255 family)
MSNKMPNAPVIYAIAMVRFSPIEKMTSFSVEFQEYLRLEGFTEYNTIEQMNVQVTIEKDAVNTTRNTEPLWIYTNQARTDGFLLSKDFLCFHTTSYDTHEPFLDKLILGLKKLNEIASISYVTKLGLRYIDVGRPNPGESNSQYLFDGFDRIPTTGKSLVTTTEAYLEIDTQPLIEKGTMIARVHSVVGQPLGLPHDLSLHGLVLSPKFVNHDSASSFVMLDIDHSVNGAMQLDFGGLRDQSECLHGNLRDYFEKTFSTYAKSVWGAANV